MEQAPASLVLHTLCLPRFFRGSHFEDVDEWLGDLNRVANFSCLDEKEKLRNMHFALCLSMAH